MGTANFRRMNYDMPLVCGGLEDFDDVAKKYMEEFGEEMTEDSSVICYSGVNQYVIYADSGYYTLSVRRPDGLEETYACSTLSVAIASMEDLEQGKEI